MPRQTPPVESLVQHVRSLLDEMAGLGRVLQAIDPDVAMDRFSSDKKHEKERYTVIIPDSEGRLARVQLERSASNSSLIREAFVAILQEQPKV
jgi:3-dehydroquinate synthetase